MKKTVLFCKCFVCVLLALTLASALTIAVFASATALQSSDTPRTLSLFLSNFIETGLTNYSDSVSDASVAAAVLKHIEINAAQFSDGVSVRKDANGQQYMQVSAERFQERARDMFARSIKASACPGYANGMITVTADGANAPVNVLATPDNAPVLTQNGYYTVTFTVFSITGGSPSALYGYTSDVSADRAKAVATGQCVFDYTGDAVATELNSYDFTVISYQTMGSFSPVTGVFGDNLPYTPAAASTTLPSYTGQPSTTLPGVSTTDGTTAPTENTTTPTDGTTADAETGDTTSTSEVTTSVIVNTTEQTPGGGEKNMKPYVIYVAVLLALLAAAGVVIVILIAKRKTK